jgi:hypothetical protein
VRRTALLAVIAIAGCGGGSSDRPAPKRDTRSDSPTGLSDARIIRAWVEAIDRADYETAASFFAPGAIVQQAEVFRLPDHRAALAFNRSLPCKADLTKVKDEGRTTLGTFKLRVGPAGQKAGCDSTVRVRFRLRKGRFKEWRQLPERPAPEGQTA